MCLYRIGCACIVEGCVCIRFLLFWQMPRNVQRTDGVTSLPDVTIIPSLQSPLKMNPEQVFFGGDLVCGTLRLVLADLQVKFDGKLLDLTMLDLLASQYELDHNLAPAWNRLLLPDTVYRYLSAVADGYQVQCRPVLKYFRTMIEELVHDHLDSASEGRNRKDLIAILDKCTAEVEDGDLSAQNYYDDMAERALEWPYDPDFQSEHYYEHQDRLEIDEGYAEMTRHNAELREDQDRRHRRDGQTAWVSFWQSARELASTGPTAHFRIDLYHAHNDDSMSSP